MAFNKQNQINKIKPAVDKLISYLQTKGIECSLVDGDLENAIFTKNNVTLKIGHHCLYRYSGIACIYSHKGENFIEAVEVTDQMYMDVFMKPHIENYFK